MGLKVEIGKDTKCPVLLACHVLTRPLKNAFNGLVKQAMDGLHEP